MSEATPQSYAVHFGGQTFTAREVRGREALSTPFRVEAWLTVDRGDAPDPRGLLKTPGAVRIERAGGVLARAIGGIITEMVVGASRHSSVEVRIVIEPRLALARLRRDMRAFRNKSVPEIVTEVLAAVGSAPALRLSAAYPPRPYTVQLSETDFDFVSRLLEEEGIFYFFTEAGDLVLGDSPAAYEPSGAALPFHPEAALADDLEAILAIGRRAALAAGTVTLRDFNPDHPRVDMEVSAPAASHGPAWARPVYDDFPGGYRTPGEGARRAAVIAEGFACASGRVEGRSSSAALAPGRTFDLVDAPPGMADGSIVVASVEHAWERENGGYTADFQGLPANVTFRPPRITPVPQQLNPMTGFVAGPSGADFHTDEVGHVKVWFPWERGGPRDDKASAWIPVLQDNTCSSAAIPRIGWEVLVHYIEGNPDNPVVLGRLYNGADRFPEPLPQGKTRSAIRSLSSPGRDGVNMIRLEDAAGREELLIHAERDARVIVTEARREDVLGDERARIGRDELRVIQKDEDVTASGDILAAIGRDQIEAVAGRRERSVGDADAIAIAGNRRLSIGSGHNRKIGTHDSVAAREVREQISAVAIEASLGPCAALAGRDLRLTVGGAIVEMTADAKSESAKLARSELIGGAAFTKAGGAISATTGKVRATTVGGMLSVSAAKGLDLQGEVRLSATGAIVDLQGTTSAILSVGETSLTLKEGVIGLKSTGDIRITITGTNEQGAQKSLQN